MTKIPLARRKAKRLKPRVVHLFKARGLGIVTVQDVVIKIGERGEVPEPKDLDCARQGFRLQAESLYDAMKSLPGGTIDALFGLLCQKKASLWVVQPHQ